MLYYWYLERRDRQINDYRKVSKYEKICTEHSMVSKEGVTCFIAGKGCKWLHRKGDAWVLSWKENWCFLDRGFEEQCNQIPKTARKHGNTSVWWECMVPSRVQWWWDGRQWLDSGRCPGLCQGKEFNFILLHAGDSVERDVVLVFEKLTSSGADLRVFWCGMLSLFW